LNAKILTLYYGIYNICGCEILTPGRNWRFWKKRTTLVEVDCPFGLSHGDTAQFIGKNIYRCQNAWKMRRKEVS